MRHKDIHVIKGKNPILISAPHTRAIEIKKEETPYTKAAEERVLEIVKALCAQSGAWGVFIKGAGKIRNWENELRDIYKQHIHHLISTHNVGLFIEIHGSRPSRPFVIDYDFLIPNKHPQDKLLEKFLIENAKKHFSSQHISKGFFRSLNGSGEKTFTYFVRKTFKIPALQIEINKKAREDEEQFSRILNTLHNTIQQYQEETLS